MPVAVLIPVYLGLVLLPLVLAWAQGLPPRPLADDLASGAGLVALAMILAEFFLLGRFRAVTRRAGSDVVMRAHQVLARAALVIVVAHPFLYVSPMVPPPVWDVTRQTALNYGWEGLWPGIAAWLEAPHGHLTHEDHADAPGIALIAGGVGIAPLLGILRELAATGDARPVVLLYGNRRAAQIVARAGLERLAAGHGAEVVHVLSEPPEGWTGATGMIDADLLQRQFGDAARRDWLYILCGPPAMLASVEAALRGLGIAPARILSERFVYD